MAVVGVGVAPVGVGFGGATPPKGRVSGVPPGWMASVSAAKVPQSRRAGAHRAAGGFAADLPRRAGAGRGFKAAGERIGVKNPSRAGLRGGGRRPNPDTIRTGSVTAPRFRSRGTSFAVRVALPYPINTTHLGRVCSSGRRSASHPRARKTSDLPPGTESTCGHHTDINKTAKQ